MSTPAAPRAEYDVYGLAFRLCDGLSAIAPDEADTLVIAGMGGETIIHILESAPWTRGCTLLLQPQTKIELLRAWLREHGYAADAERLVEDKGKLYLVLSVRGAEPGTASVLEQYGGFCLEGDPLYGAYLDAADRAPAPPRGGHPREPRGGDAGALVPCGAAGGKEGGMAAWRPCVKSNSFSIPGHRASSRRAGTTWVCSSATRTARSRGFSSRST